MTRASKAAPLTPLLIEGRQEEYAAAFAELNGWTLRRWHYSTAGRAGTALAKLLGIRGDSRKDTEYRMMHLMLGE